MLPDRVSNPAPLTYESGALPIALRGPAHCDGPMKIFLTCAAAFLRCPTARSRNRQNYIRIFAAQSVEKNAKTLRPRKPMHIYKLSQCDYDNLGYALNR